MLDAVVIVGADEGLETIDATDSCPRDQPILHDEQALLTVYIEVLGVAELVVLDDAIGLKEAILWVFVVCLIDGMREHCVGKVRDRKVTACVGKKSNSQLKLKTRRQETENAMRDEEDERWRRETRGGRTDGDKDMEKDIPT